MSCKPWLVLSFLGGLDVDGMGGVQLVCANAVCGITLSPCIRGSNAHCGCSCWVYNDANAGALCLYCFTQVMVVAHLADDWVCSAICLGP